MVMQMNMRFGFCKFCRFVNVVCSLFAIGDRFCFVSSATLYCYTSTKKGFRFGQGLQFFALLAETLEGVYNLELGGAVEQVYIYAD